MILTLSIYSYAVDENLIHDLKYQLNLVKKSIKNSISKLGDFKPDVLNQVRPFVSSALFFHANLL